MKIESIPEYTKLSFSYSRHGKEPELLLDFLARRFCYFSQQKWEESIHEGRIFIDSMEAGADQVLKNAQIITYLRPDHLEPLIDPWFEIIYEDDSLIGLNKSGNLPTSPSGRYFKNTLLHQVKIHKNWEQLYTIHRLDRETSGVVLFAKTLEMAQHMAKLFQSKQIRKKYTAILSKPLPSREVFLSIPIGRSPDSDVRIKQSVSPEGKLSQTYFRQQERLGPYYKTEVEPLTGRTHQIRVHAAYMGNPIVGDKVYALAEGAFLQWLAEGESFLEKHHLPTHRHLLHASEIRFVHPLTQKFTVIHAGDQLMMQYIELNTN
ncbi:RluA family pseudouridine synthase [Deltaproteobacteria bacterium TL4]